MHRESIVMIDISIVVFIVVAIIVLVFVVIIVIFISLRNLRSHFCICSHMLCHFAVQVHLAR